MMKVPFSVVALLAATGAAAAQPVQSGPAGGMPYLLLPASGGCSAATPCSVVTYLSYMDETAQATASDVRAYFGGAFAAQNPHTIVIAPMIAQPQSTSVNWGGYDGVGSPQQQQMVAVVRSVEQSMGNSVNTADSVVTGGSLGGDGTQSALINYGPKGLVQPGVFSAGLSFDAATYAAAGNAASTRALCGVPLMAVHGTADTDQSVAYDENLSSTIDGNALCGNSFTFVPVQGAGHGTWGGSSGYPAGDGPGTPLAWLSGQLKGGAARPAATAPTAPAALIVAATPATPATASGASAGGSTATAPSVVAQGAAAAPASGSTAPAGGAAPSSGSQAAPSGTVTPGSGSLTDASGNTWSVSQSGSVQENGQWVAGGGGTAALTIRNGVVYGEDAQGRGWLGFSPASQEWAPVPAPAATAAAVAPAAPVAAASPVTATPAAQAAEPATCGAAPDGQATGQFTTANGQIYDPDGHPFIARGIGVMEGNQPSVATLESKFPGLNFVRLAIYDYASASALDSYVTSLTSRGIVVEIEDHSSSDGQDRGGGTGAVFTGQRLQTELSWYAAVASHFKANAYVWFGTDNEPPGPPDALSQWELQTYQAIRSTGNNNLIMLEMQGGGTVAGFTPSAFAQMFGVIWDPHVYGWFVNYSTDLGVIKAAIAQEIAHAQAIKGAGGATIPVLIGEYGNSTTGEAPDANGSQVLTAVQSSGLGSAAWAWDYNPNGDGLSDGGNGLSGYGQEVAGFIALIQGAAPSVWACSPPALAAPAQQAVAQAAATVAAMAPAASAAPAPAQAAATPIPSAVTATARAVQQATAAADADVATAGAQASAVQATVDPARTAARTGQADALLHQALGAMPQPAGTP